MDWVGIAWREFKHELSAVSKAFDGKYHEKYKNIYFKNNFKSPAVEWLKVCGIASRNIVFYKKCTTVRKRTFGSWNTQRISCATHLARQHLRLHIFLYIEYLENQFCWVWTHEVTWHPKMALTNLLLDVITNERRLWNWYNLTWCRSTIPWTPYMKVSKVLVSIPYLVV